MKKLIHKVTSDKRDGVTFRMMSANLRTIILTLFLSYSFTVLNAQIEIKELKLTPEITEIVVAQLKQFLPEKSYSDYGIKNKDQLEHLHLGKPIPNYRIVSDVNKKLDDVSVNSVPLISDGEPLSLRFMDTWNVPVMFDETFLFFALISSPDEGYSYLITLGINAIDFHNYEHKDLIVGAVNVTSSLQGMDNLIIQKENQDIFVEIYDEVTGEYFKNEYNLREFINHLRELNLRKKEARMRYYAQIANKSELKLTPEMEKMVISMIDLGYKNVSDEMLPKYGIKNRSKLMNLHLGKPIPLYRIIDDNLTFIGWWDVPVMSDGEPVLLTSVNLKDDGEYTFGGASVFRAALIHNYEHKDLIVGFLGTRSFNGIDYVIIRKENQDIFVGVSDYVTSEPLKHEYSLSEIINLIKQ
jgi:hypothetical protein